MSKKSPICIGIDLGTTRSVVATLDAHGSPKTLPNSEGNQVTPSAVLFEDNEVIVGDEALKAVEAYPEKVALHVKREVGNEDYLMQTDNAAYPAEVIQSFILGKLRRDAERALGHEVQEAVITVPAFFNEPRRRATIDAGLLAGLNVRAVVNEPTAAALAFFESNGVRIDGQLDLAKETILVYDLGGGTFDASLLVAERQSINVIAIDGNSRLGGVDWDQCLADWLAEQFTQKLGVSPADLQSEAAFFLREAEAIKHTLSAKKKTNARIRLMNHVLQCEVTRDLFNELTAHLLDRTRFTIKKLLEAADKSWHDIDHVLLVGGSTRMPQVAEMLQRESSMNVNQSVSPDQSVAQGAALWGAILADEKTLKGKTQNKVPGLESASQKHTPSRLSVSDVNAHHLGILGVELATGRPQSEVMIPRNTSLPAKRAMRFETIRDNQDSVVVRVVEGGDHRGAGATLIGSFVVQDLPMGLPKGSPVDVRLKYNRNGIIEAEAVVAKTGRANHIRIDRKSGLSENQLKHWQDLTEDIQDALGLND